MKHVWQHPEDPLAGKRTFRSLGELMGTPGFNERLEQEFPRGAAELKANGDEDESVSRRRFMRLMGASTALAGLGLAACRRPVGKILPYSGSVEWIIPGKPLFYATAMPRPGGATPIIATTHEGRPTHLQGNPLHPNSNGGTDQFAIASILELYDPERARDYKKSGRTISAEDFNALLDAKKKELHAASGKGLAILHGASTSATRARVLGQIAEKLSESKTYEYEAVGAAGLDTATEALFGEGKRQVYRLDKADRILSIGCDFLGLDQIADNVVGDFSQGRKLEGDDKAESMNRLYVLEHQFTLTGGAADHRQPLKVSQMLAAAAAIAAKVGELAGDAALSKLATAASKSGEGAVPAGWVEGVSKDLVDHIGKSVVVAGPRLDPVIHALVAGINNALKAYGADKPADVVDTGNAKAGNIADLAKAIGAGEVSTLVITTEADPVYSAPADLKFGELLEKVDTVIYVGVRDLCATARAADWQVPGAHYLESWGDVRASDGTYSIVQPMIAPLFDGVSELAFLLGLVAEGEAAEGVDPAHAAVKETFATFAKADADKAWNTSLRNGFLKDSAYASAAAAPDAAAAEKLGATVVAPAAEGVEVVFTADNKVYDGRHINNGWLQELPDPITSLVWDNAALVSIGTLKKLGLSDKELVIEDKTRLLKVKVGDVEGYFPILPAPGHARDSVSISMGYGQTDAGWVAGSPQAKGEDTGATSGFDVSPLRKLGSDYVATAEISLVDSAVELRPDYKTKTYPIAITQEHFNMEGRALYRDGTLEEFENVGDDYKPDDFNHRSSFQKRGMDSHRPPNHSVYRGQDFDKLGETISQWGMTIDLNQCIGCTACTIACQSENNIPIVGKDQVIIGREMHWIRMDRYFAPAMEKDDHGHWHVTDKELDNPQLLPQPVACAQCEAAPCETVCPVNATVHTEDGLNAMAYNRCIGTRYCANNCPYKARRFNFFDYNKRPADEFYKGPLSSKDKTGVAPSLQLQKNPNVTVRMRGVMEKCTFCVQRIQEAKIAQKRVARDSDDTRVPPDAVKVACQQACPAEAIGFGDLADEKSMVNKIKASPRNYEMLAYLDLGSRTTYLARIKNPNTAKDGEGKYLFADADQAGRVSERIH